MQCSLVFAGATEIGSIVAARRATGSIDDTGGESQKQPRELSHKFFAGW